MFHVVLIFTVVISIGLGAGRVSTGEVQVDATGNANAASQFQPEPQEPTGKFTTATEVKPILTATKTAWLALREYEGQDLLYFTHLAAWRCGLHQVRYVVNGGAEQVFELEPCHIDTAQPNALKMEGHLPYLSFDLGSVNEVAVTVLYDDGSQDAVEFQRKEILMP